MKIEMGYTERGRLRYSRGMKTGNRRVRERVSQNKVCMKRVLESLRSCNLRKTFNRIW